MNSNGKVVPRRTVKRLTAEQLAPYNAVEITQRSAFDANISRKLGDSFTLPGNRKAMNARAKGAALDDFMDQRHFLI